MACQVLDVFARHNSFYGAVYEATVTACTNFVTNYTTCSTNQPENIACYARSQCASKLSCDWYTEKDLTGHFNVQSAKEVAPRARGIRTRMVYRDYITCLRYTLLVREGGCQSRGGRPVSAASLTAVFRQTCQWSLVASCQYKGWSTWIAWPLLSAVPHSDRLA